LHRLTGLEVEALADVFEHDIVFVVHCNDIRRFGRPCFCARWEQLLAKLHAISLRSSNSSVKAVPLIAPCMRKCMALPVSGSLTT
jgi:hypothetical protein